MTSLAEHAPRLKRLLDRVQDVTADGAWHTLAELASRCQGAEASISARLRDLRKMGYTVESEHVRDGLYKYRVKAPEQAALFDVPPSSDVLTMDDRRRAVNAWQQFKRYAPREVIEAMEPVLQWADKKRRAV